MKSAYNIAGPYTRTPTLADSEYRAGLTMDSQQSPAATFMSWARWLMSVLCTSMFISYIINGGPLNMASVKSALQTTSSKNTHPTPVD
jgi:hypothetical protein